MRKRARTAGMAKLLKRPVVASDEVARRSPFALADLGLHALRGIPTARRLSALDVGRRILLTPKPPSPQMPVEHPRTR